MSIVKSFPDLPHTPGNAQLAVMLMVVSQKLDRKCTVPTGLLLRIYLFVTISLFVTYSS